MARDRFPKVGFGAPPLYSTVLEKAASARCIDMALTGVLSRWSRRMHPGADNFLGRLAGPVAPMSLWKSHAVKEWIRQKANPGGITSGGHQFKYWEPWVSNAGRRNGPRLSAQTRASKLKEAIRFGEITLEPTVMVPSPHFKGTRRKRDAAQRKEDVAEKMAKMPQVIKEHKEDKHRKRQEIKKENYFRNKIK